MSKKRRRQPGRKEAASDADLQHANDDVLDTDDGLLEADEIVETDDGVVAIVDGDADPESDAAREPDAEVIEQPEPDAAQIEDAEPDAEQVEDLEAHQEHEPESDPGAEPEPEPEEIVESDEGIAVVAEWDDTGDEPVPDAAAPDELVSRLEVIGAQPLGERADALSQVHDELRTRLESGDSPRASA